MLRLLLFAALLGGGGSYALSRPGTASPASFRLQENTNAGAAGASSLNSNQFRSSYLYDPIMNDPKLKARYSEEMRTIARLDARTVREELLALNNNSSILLNKDLGKEDMKKEELGHLLARLRVKHWLMEQQSSSMRASRAHAIREEKEKVQLLGDREVISELRTRQVQFSPVADRDQLDSLLAISRLSPLPPAGESRADIAQKWIDKAANLKSTIESRIKQQQQQQSSLISDNGSSGRDSDEKGRESNRGSAASSARKIIDGLVMTDSEREAHILLNHNQRRAAASPAASESASSDQTDDFEAFEQRLNSCSNFDEIVSYCLREGCSREFIAKMLGRQGITVPRYAPLSALVNMLADQMLVQRGSSSSSERSAPRRVTSSVRRISDYDEFALERDIFAEGSRRVRSFLQVFLRSRLTLPTNSELRRGLAEVSKGIFGSNAFTAIRSALSLAAILVADAALGAARWAGGTSVLKPPQTLCLLCAYALVTRGGVVSFLASFLVLRFVRVIVLSSDLDDNNENEQQELAPPQ